jgi:hypothetical protein
MKFISSILLGFVFCNPLANEYSNLDSILSKYVDPDGLVNYQAIIDSPYNINEYLDFIKNVSPQSHPKLFPTKNDKLAYWINAYNALVIKLMIENPGTNILEISFGHLIWLTKFDVGLKKISLYEIEHKILRKLDSRIHFAISCGSKSCPPLGQRVFLGSTLDVQLENSAKDFINDKNNVFIDFDNKTLYLNKIFKWYKKDFNNVKKYIVKYLNDGTSFNQIKGFNIKYNDYDWSLNSQMKK